MSTNILAIGALVTGAFLVFSPQEQHDRAGVRRAVLDYVEAIEQAKPELIERSVSKDLAKFGFSQDTAGGAWRHHPMSFERLVEVAREMKELGYVPEHPEHEVTLFEVLDKTASVKLEAFWGIDYMHLVKDDGKWKIVQVLWQTKPLGGEQEHAGDPDRGNHAHGGEGDHGAHGDQDRAGQGDGD